MNSKYTKEEWKLHVTDVTVEGKPIKVAEIGPDRRFRIAMLQSSHDHSHGYSEEEMMANARLMLNARNMFSLLGRMVEYSKIHNWPGTVNPTIDGALLTEAIEITNPQTP